MLAFTVTDRVRAGDEAEELAHETGSKEVVATQRTRGIAVHQLGSAEGGHVLGKMRLGDLHQ
jgi:hypothetical protein